MKRQILLLILPFLAVFAPITTHPVDLPKMETIAAEKAPVSAMLHTRFEETIKGVTLTNNEVYSILCGVSAILHGKSKNFAFPSETSKNIYKEIHGSYLKLKKESEEKANAYLGWTFVQLAKHLDCFAER